MRGRNGNRSYTSTHGGDGRSINVGKLDAMLRGSASVQDRRYGPSPAEMRRCLANAECPFCGRQFRNVAAHVTRSHGIDRNQLKDMAEIPRSRSVCSEEYRETCAEAGRRRHLEHPELGERLRANLDRTAPRTYSPGGKLAQRLKSCGSAEPGVMTAQALEARVKAGHTITERRRAASAERDRRIVDMVRAGASAAEVRAELGLAVAAGNKVIKQALKYYGVDVDLRQRRGRSNRA